MRYIIIRNYRHQYVQFFFSVHTYTPQTICGRCGARQNNINFNSVILLIRSGVNILGVVCMGAFAECNGQWRQGQEAIRRALSKQK